MNNPEYQKLLEIITYQNELILRNLKNEFTQIESLLSLFFSLQPRIPIPDTRVWAASPDLLKKISEVIFREKPKFVVEAGSGVSTLIIAYCLEQIGEGKVVSLEHDCNHAANSQDMISLHVLQGIATIIHAPLKEIKLNGHKWLWYDTDFLNIDEPIEFLFIDGPPGSTQKLARYPALPILFERLDNGATIILDDGHRKDEKEIVELWSKEFNDITYKFLPLEKGAFLIHKQVKPESD